MSDSADNKLHVLIVDDDEFLLDIYSRKFSDEGHEINAASSAQTALDMLADDEFDVVMFDIVMPAMDGIELLGKIQEESLAPDATLIVLSNQGSPDDIKRAEELGVDGYIVKASTVPSEVLDLVKEMHEKRQKSS